MFNCKKCGATIVSDAKLCSACGEPIETHSNSFYTNASIDISQLEQGKQSQESKLSRGYQIDIINWFKQSWEIFQSYPIGFICYALIIVGINFIPVINIIASFISVPLYVGMQIVAIKKIRGEAVEFKNFFDGFNFFLPLFVAELVVLLFVVLGLILLIIPGIYLAVSYVFVALLIVDKKLSVWEAMELSRKTVTKNWLDFFLLLIITALINFAGLIALGVGLLVTLPVTICAIAVGYEKIFKHKGE